MRTSIGTFILIIVASIVASTIVISSQADAYPAEFSASVSLSGYERTLVAINGTIVTAHVADTEEKRHQGLSGTNTLSPKEGMLFVFPKDDHHSFWMKDMTYPIDIIWFSAKKQIVDIAYTVSPETYSGSFSPQTNARYFLEVPAGFSSSHNLSIGDIASW